MIEIINLGHVLGLSLEHLDASRRERTLREFNERLWPSEILEDILDAEDIVDPAICFTNPIIGITAI